MADEQITSELTLLVEGLSMMSTYRPSAAPLLARILAEGKAIAFDLDVERCSTYGVVLTPVAAKLGPMFRGGQLDEYRIVVSVMRIGAWPFDFRDAHPNYVAEKLDLPPPDAQAIARMINEVGTALRAFIE